MLASIKNIIGLSVETQSGESLGKVVDINLNIENHIINDYVVWHGFLNRKEYLIKPSQVVNINENKMVVEDSVMRIVEKENLEEGKEMLAGVSAINQE